MSEDRIEGTVKNGFGRAQDAYGGLTGDTATQAKGKLNQVAGTVQDKIGQVKDQAQDALGQAQDALGQARTRAEDAYGEIEAYAREKPAAALGFALGAGLLLGLLLRGGTRTVYVAGRP